jgi:ankyrin repeat protein
MGAAQKRFDALVAAVAGGHPDIVRRTLSVDHELAILRSDDERFIDAASHQLYAGDTALHMAAAAFQRAIAETLMRYGANIRARNRRGAEPLHYAADANHWAPIAQRETIEYLLEAGADPNALDNSGVAPLHRAVRTRSSEAVSALLNGGADASLKNKRGSTPMYLAARNTGRGGSGSERAKEEQRKIMALLLAAGADTV